MTQFDINQQFDRLLKSRCLAHSHIESLIGIIVAFHSRTKTATESCFGDAVQTHLPVHQNYQQINSQDLSTEAKLQIDRLLRWHNHLFSSLKDTINTRKSNGFVRECHGDLHLGNIAYFNNKVVIFDRLEFDENLRNIDVINEIAFLIMDIEACQRPDLANYCLNQWLSLTGDYASLHLLNYYKAYRSMVRAKVALLGGSREQFKTYLELTERYAHAKQQALIFTHGLSGSGKSSITQTLALELNAVIVRSDVERKRHFAEELNTIYNDDTTQKTYDILATACADIINSGLNAIIDATFLQQAHRQQFIALARRLECPCIILDFHAPTEQLEQWIIERNKRGNDVSDATVEVLHKQIQSQEQLSAEELRMAISIDTSHNIDVNALANSVKKMTAQEKHPA